MTKYINNKICAEPEARIVTYCVDHDLEFNRVTARKIVLEACKDKPIIKTAYDSSGLPRYQDITQDVAWEYTRDKNSIECVQEKIAYLKQSRAEKLFNANIESDKKYAKPDLEQLVEALYPFNIVDEQGYLAVVYFLMQLKATRNAEMPKNRKSQRIALFLSGVQGNGKTTFAETIMEIEKNYGITNYVNDAEAFSSRFEENLWKAHLNFCDEVVPSAITRSNLIRAVDGGSYQLERKNQMPYNWNVNTNLIFASNDNISLKQRRVAVVKFGEPCTNAVSFEFLTECMQKAMRYLPDFRWHQSMYHNISHANQTRLNPLGVESISKFLGGKFGCYAPDSANKTIKFNTSQIFDMLKGLGREYLKTERKEAIKNALNEFSSRGFVTEFKYKNSTTKQYTIDLKQYYTFREWADTINTLDEKNAKITKRQLKDLLAPYFEHFSSDKHRHAETDIIFLPAPVSLLALPSPDNFNNNIDEEKTK